MKNLKGNKKQNEDGKGRRIDLSYIFDEAIDNHFLQSEFYVDTMSPRFMNSPEYDKLSLGLPVLCGRFVLEDDYVLVVYMNKVEIYGEVQTPWRGFNDSTYLKFKEEPGNIEEIIDAINKVLSQHDGNVELRSLSSEEFILGNGNTVELVSDYKGISLTLNGSRIPIGLDTYELVKRDLGKFKEGMKRMDSW